MPPQAHSSNSEAYKFFVSTFPPTFRFYTIWSVTGGDTDNTTGSEQPAQDHPVGVFTIG
jgi:hypothetical protein